MMSAADRVTKFFNDNSAFIADTPHFNEWKTLQVYVYDASTQANKFTSVFTQYDVVTPYMPVKSYLAPGITSHWGQLKLLIVEVEFLALCMRVYPLSILTKTKIVYVGAAAGLHIIWLSKLFPMLSFDLWDLSKFHPKLIEYANIFPQRVTIYNRLLTPFTAKQYMFDSRQIMISDLRVVSTTKDFSKTRGLIDTDHELQITLVNILQPIATMLKFNPPRPNEITTAKYRYYKGINTLHPFCPNKSTETRLIFFNQAFGYYDLDLYDNQQMHLNCRMRNLFIHESEFFVLHWKELNQIKRKYVNIPFLNKYDYTYDLWRFVQVFFIYYATMIPSSPHLPLPINFSDPDPDSLITLNRLDVETIIPDFIIWFEKQFNELSDTLNSTFDKHMLSRRNINLERIITDQI